MIPRFPALVFIEDGDVMKTHGTFGMSVQEIHLLLQLMRRSPVVIAVEDSDVTDSGRLERP